MPAAFDELVVAVIDRKVLVQTQINQPIVASPAVGMDDAVGVYFPSNNGLQRGFGCIGDDLGVNAVAAFEQTKDDGFAACTASTFTPNTLGAKVGLIGFKLARKR